MELLLRRSLTNRSGMLNPLCTPTAARQIVEPAAGRTFEPERAAGHILGGPRRRRTADLGGQRDRSLGGVAQERQGFLHVQLYGFGIVRQVADGDVSAQLQVEIASPRGQYECA